MPGNPIDVSCPRNGQRESKHRRFRLLPRSWWGLLARLPLYYLGIVAFMYLYQDRLLYLPERSDLQAAMASGRASGLRMWPSESAGYRGFVAEACHGKPLGTVLVFHGNAGNAVGRDFYARAFNRLGYRTILLEYPGYGARPGEHGEEHLVSDALKSFEIGLSQFAGPTIVVGESMGCAVASAVAAHNTSRVGGVLLVTPWDTLPDLAQSKYWFLPARWLAKDSYDNIRNLRQYCGPVAIAVAESDTIIPKARAQRLFESIPNRKKLWMFPNCGHNDWPSGATENWWKEAVEFFGLRMEEGR